MQLGGAGAEAARRLYGPVGLSRRYHRGEEIPCRMPGYPLLPLLFVIFAVAFVLYNAWDAVEGVGEALGRYGKTGELEMTGLYPLLVTGVILLGLPAYYFFTRRYRN